MEQTKEFYESAWNYACGEAYGRVKDIPENMQRGGTHGEQALAALGEYKLFCLSIRLGDEKYCPWANLDRLDYFRLHLINKHHWTLDQVCDLKQSDMLFLLHDELKSMVLTEKESAPIHRWGCQDQAWLLVQPHVTPA